MAQWQRNMWISSSIIPTTGWLAERSLLLLITTAMWGEGWPPPLLEMSATSVYIQSYRNSGWRSPYTKTSHISLSTFFWVIPFYWRRGRLKFPTLKGHTFRNILHQIPVETKKTSLQCMCQDFNNNSSYYKWQGIVIWYHTVNSLPVNLLLHFYVQFVSGLHERIVVIKNFFLNNETN